MRRRDFSAAVAVFGLIACGGAPEATPPQAEQRAAKPKPPDESRRFAKDGRVSMELVEDELMDKDYLPGGNLASYEKGGQEWRQFLIVTGSPDDAALLAFEIKGKLAAAKFVPHFGGHFGMDGETPWFIFPKDKYVAGIVGLPEEEADRIAREFAARIY